MMTKPAPRPILCIVVDDEAFRTSLVTLLLRESFDIVASTTAAQFFDRLPDHRPACALVDLRLQGIDGLHALRSLAARGPSLPVIAMTERGDARGAVRAIKAGAMDFIEKPVDRAMLLELLDAAFTRSRCHASSEQDRAAFVTRLRRLTEREHAVFDRMLGGKPNKIIAHELAISPRTVEIHRARVMEKLEAGSMAQLVRCATRAALVEDEAF